MRNGLKGGLAARVLVGSAAVGSAASLTGCGAALLAGAGYLAAEKIAQSNVEAARIRDRSDRYLAERERKSDLLERSEELSRTQFFVCSYADPSLDQEPNSFCIKEDIIGRRTEILGRFDSNEGVYFVGQIAKAVGNSTLKIYNNKGEIIFSETTPIGEGIVHWQGYKPGDLTEGVYKGIWLVNDKMIGSVECEVNRSNPGQAVTSQR